MRYFGDYLLGSTVVIPFTTISTTGAPAQLAGTTSTTISVYPNVSTTQITAGAVLTTDFDGVTGFNMVSIAATGGNGFAVASDYTVMLATGTVGGTTVAGYVVGNFSIQNRMAKLAAGEIGPTTFTAGAIVATTFAGVLPSNFSSLSINASGLVGITSNIKKNATTVGFMFIMTNMTTHLPVDGLTVTGQVSLDKAAFTALVNSGSITSIGGGSGAYGIDFVPADMNGNHAMLFFSNATADPRLIEIITQP